MSDSVSAILGAIVLAVVGVGGVLVALGGGDVAAFTDAASGFAGRALLVVAALAIVAAITRVR